MPSPLSSGPACTQASSCHTVARWPRWLHVGKKRPHPSRDQSPETHRVMTAGPRSTQRRQSGQDTDWLRSRSSLGPAMSLHRPHGLRVGQISKRQGGAVAGSRDVGGPEKWRGSPLDAPPPAALRPGLSPHYVPFCVRAVGLATPLHGLESCSSRSLLPSSMKITTSTVFVLPLPCAKHVSAPIYLSRDPCH